MRAIRPTGHARSMDTSRIASRQTTDTPDIAPRTVQGPPDVTISAGQGSLSISGGQSVHAQFTVSAENIPNGDLPAVHVGSLPAGITAEFSALSGDIFLGATTTLTLTAAPDVTPTVATLIVSATAGPAHSEHHVTLDVTATGQLIPKYQLLTVVYAPPGTSGGSSSQVMYSNSSTTGTTASIDSSFQAGVDVSASVGDGLAGTDFTASQTTDNTSSVSISKTSGYTITVPGPGQDGIDHGNDRFVLWLNPLLNVTVSDQVTWEMGVNGREMIIQWVYASWLQDPSSMPPGVLQALDTAGLDAADYAQILSCNPFVSGDTAIDPDRFVPLSTTVPYEPPLSPGDTPANTGITQVSDTTDTDTTQAQVQYGISYSVSPSIVDFLGLNGSQSLQWTYTSTSTQTGDSSQSASTTIYGPAFGYTGPTDVYVYWDTVFSSFMFSFTSGPVPQPSPQPASTYSAPSVTQVSNNTVIAAQGPNNSLQFYWQPVGSGQWNPETPGGPGTAYSVPSVARVSNNTVIAVQGPNNSLQFYWQPVGSGQWNPETPGGPGSAYSVPSVAQVGNNTVIAVQGPNNSLQFYWQPVGSGQWNPETPGGPGSAYSAPSVAQVGNNTVIAVQGPNNSLQFYWQPIGSRQWNQETSGGAGTTYSAPSVAPVSHNTVIAAQGPNNSLQFYWQPIGSRQWNQETPGRAGQHLLGAVGGPGQPQHGDRRPGPG